MHITQKNKPIIIAYHADCIDGAASAWCVATAHGFAETPAPDHVTYIPYAHHAHAQGAQAVRDHLTAETTLYFVDMAPEKDFLDALMAPTTEGAVQPAAIHIYDHHKTAAHALKDYQPPQSLAPQPDLNIVIHDTCPSAAAMIWTHLMPGKEAPALLQLIDKMDGDAAGLKTPADCAAASFVDSYDVSSPEKALDAVRNLAKLSFQQAAQRGEILCADQEKRLRRLVQHPQFTTVQLQPHTPPIEVPIVQADLKEHKREISERLVSLAHQHGAHAAFSWYVQGNGRVSLSIRTDDQMDASEIAALLTAKLNNVSGGGHARAAAVHFPSLISFASQMPLKPRIELPCLAITPVNRAAPSAP